jgi:phosphoribosylglycinamide formyltransferase-1
MAESITKDTLQLFQDRPPVAVLMSGSGSNAINLLSNQEIRDFYDIKAVVTDKSTSQARAIAVRFGLPYEELESTTSLADSHTRDEYFESLSKILSNMGVKALFYAGFMKISSEKFTKDFPGVNVHPADLTIEDEDGLPIYRGMDAMNDMARDLGYVSATVHVIDTPVDSGTSLSVSEPLAIRSGESNKDLHERLKKLEHIIYPETLIRMAKGEMNETHLPVTIPTASKDIPV